MKRIYLLVLLVIISFDCYSQISFEKGYYIDNSGQKIDCLIKNSDWAHTPNEIQFKLETTTEPKTVSVKLIKEFEIFNSLKYVKELVKTDLSGNDVAGLTYNKRAVYKEEQLLLKVLVEGKASLYSYDDGTIKKYFYEKDSSHINQLIFKKYLNADGKIGENNMFRQQLWTDLNCEDLSVKNIQNINYDENDLVNFFVKYNDCNNSQFNVFKVDQKKDLFNLTIRPGIDLSSFELQYSGQDFDKQSSIIGFRFGIEAELVMPFNKNKWSVLLEPVYQSFKYDKTVYDQKMSVESKTLALPVGIRYYFFLNDKSKVFINGSFVMGMSLDSKVDFENGEDLDIKTKTNLALGVGYNFKSKYSVEFRYFTNTDVIDGSSSWSSNYNAMSFILGYSIF